MNPSPETHCRRAAAILLSALMGLTTWAGATSNASAEVTPQQQALVDQVCSRLLAVIDRPKDWASWPPTWAILDNAENAYAGLDPDQPPNSHVPIIRVYRGFLDDIAEGMPIGSPSCLATNFPTSFLATRSARGKTTIETSAFEREDELAADKMGMAIALKAGYSFRGGLGGPRRFIDLGDEYSSFEGVKVDHPSWRDRIARCSKPMRRKPIFGDRSAPSTRESTFSSASSTNTRRSASSASRASFPSATRAGRI